jgi:diguanylate cyclase (GGDEF)-like protein
MIISNYLSINYSSESISKIDFFCLLSLTKSNPQILIFLTLLLLLLITLIAIAVAFIFDKFLKRDQIIYLSKQLVHQTDAKINAEKKILELDMKLEQEVNKKTAALRLANQDLQENMLLMEKVANLTPSLLYIYDLEKKRNLYSNRFVSEILGYSEEEVEQNLQLAEKVIILETWHTKRIKLAQMNEFLQACLTIEEGESVLSDSLPRLFPHTHGVVYLINNSKNSLKAIAAWGLPQGNNNFAPDECWALRRSSSHLVDLTTSNLYCNHIEHQSRSSTLCLPMIAKGKTLGILYLRFDDAVTVDQLVQELAETVAQNIAMSFANLALQEELRYQNLRDPLTGLFNRRYLQESLTREINRAHRKQQFIGVMILDIDYFKRFNDIYGHSAGDRVLQEVSAYIMSEIRQYDIACRYGGEELVLILPDASIEETIVRAEEIRAGINQLKLEYDAKKLGTISVSIGVSCFPDDGVDADKLINEADRALYNAKEMGRNCVKRC